MKFKVTVSQVLPKEVAEYEEFETVYLQVLDLDENPASDIARLLNPEPEYEEEVTESTTVFPNVTFNLKPTTLADTLKSETPMSVHEVSLVPESDEKPRTGRQVTYDRGGIIADLKANVLTVKQIAEKHNVPKQTVYNVKAKFVRPEDIADDVAPKPDLSGPRQEPETPGKTEYQTKREELDERRAAGLEPTQEEKTRARIEEMVAEGCSMTELEMMFPSVPVSTLREIMDGYQDA